MSELGKLHRQVRDRLAESESVASWTEIEARGHAGGVSDDGVILILAGRIQALSDAVDLLAVEIDRINSRD